MQPRVIMLADLDYFFAQCEEIRNPSLKEKPVIVCVYSGRTEDSGAVSTANYLARKYGVRSGMPIVQAKKKLEGVDAVFLPVDHVFYEEVSARIMTILRGYADRFEQVGVDEAYLDVTRKTMGDIEKSAELARSIKNAIMNQERLTCSIGVGPNKLLAKMAADVQKPNGLTVIKPEHVETFLFPLPIDQLIGVGVKTREKMQALGIGTIGDLAGYDVQRLVGVFGKTSGTYFHNAALGIDNEPVEERGEAESISRIATLKENTRDLNMILGKADELCMEILATLLQQKLSFKSAGIATVMRDMSIRSKSKTLASPSSDLNVLKRIVRELLEKFLSESELEIRRVGVRVSNFVREERKQTQITSFIGSGTR